ncbi:N-acetylmuramoyl-L-alanine amidase family protein, partial [Bacillus pseudomycoides]|nr:N-acetylmuramoyl-L-alanine amidase family protein [Bacillus pseudomycoides]
MKKGNKMKKMIATSVLSTALLIPAIAHAEENKTIQNSTATPKVASVSKA